MSRYELMQQTQVAVVLSLNVEVRHREQSILRTIPLLPLTSLLVAWWLVSDFLQGWIDRIERWKKWVGQEQQHWEQRVEQLTSRLRVSGQLLQIGGKAVLYGCGVVL